MSLQENKSIVQEFYDQWNSGAIDFERLVHPDVTNHQPDKDPETGLDKFRQAIEGVTHAVPDSSWSTLRLIAEGDFVVCHNSWSGTYRGNVFRGVPSPQGKRFSVEHVHIYRMADSRIAEPLPCPCGSPVVGATYRAPRMSDTAHRPCTPGG